jgi:hypothetical protein
MTEKKPDRPQRNAGVFVGGPNVGVSVPMQTLSDDYHDEPTEPEDSDRVPEPEPPGILRRVVRRLLRQSDSRCVGTQLSDREGHPGSGDRRGTLGRLLAYD